MVPAGNVETLSRSDKTIRSFRDLYRKEVLRVPDKDLLKAVMELAKEQSVSAARCSDGDCVAPNCIMYFVFSNCVTINNGACEDWEFCEDD
jgi:hypothetical protein